MQKATHFPLRIIDKRLYTSLKKMAERKYTSVNSLINNILQDSLKKDKIN